MVVIEFLERLKRGDLLAPAHLPDIITCNMQLQVEFFHAVIHMSSFRAKIMVASNRGLSHDIKRTAGKIMLLRFSDHKLVISGPNVISEY